MHVYVDLTKTMMVQRGTIMTYGITSITCEIIVCKVRNTLQARMLEIMHVIKPLLPIKEISQEGIMF